MSDVFISYSRRDKDFVGQLREALVAKDQDVWVDWEDIPPSQSWWDEIQKGIAKTNNVVLVLSPHSMGSVICHMEMEYARQLKKRIIPVLRTPYERDISVQEMQARLDKPEEFTTRDVWGKRNPQALYDANDGEIKHINFFFFRPEDDFDATFGKLFDIIQTDYAHKEAHTTLSLRATEWHKRERDASFLLLDNELKQAEIWLENAKGKQPVPTELQLAYIQASQKRTRQLRNIRRASIIGSSVAVLALIFAVGASLIGVQASNNANLASTREAAANTQVANANQELTAVPPTLTQVNQQVVTAQGRADIANTQVANAQATATQIPPTLTQAAVIQEIVVGFSNALFQYDTIESQIFQIDKIVEKYPQERAVYEARGALYDSRGDYTNAIADYTRALEITPTANVYTLRGLAYDNLGKTDQAIADFDQAIELDPNYAFAYANRGGLYQTLGEYEKALVDYNQALTLEPNNALMIGNRGVVYDELGELELAVADYSRAIELDPTYLDAYIARVLIYEALGETDKYLADLSQVIALDPNNIDAYIKRGNLYQELDEIEKAVADFTQVIALDPNNVDVYIGRGYLYELLGDSDKALEDYSQAIEVDPKNDLAYFYRGWLLQVVGEYEASLPDLNQAIALNDQMAEYFDIRSGSYYSLAQASTDEAQQREYYQLVLNDFDSAQALGYQYDSDVQATIAEIRAYLATPTPTATPSFTPVPTQTPLSPTATRTP
jgi:tetratricopeptide (TPR) repeat protein